ncbi:MAG: hypothetical protein FJ023_07330 [Chloroflexi bacterium]|nr:hypothetical protein [Chloroflexota bacterium]
MSDRVTQKSTLLINADASECAGCMTCMLSCSFRLDGTFNLSAARIQVKKSVNQPNEFEIAFTKDCDRCGVCVTYCPYGALTRQRVRRAA